MNEYYSVSEYATVTGKDPGNIRRMLISGRLPGTKIGNQWAVLKGTDYPKDQRIKSGEYLSWRKKSRILSGNKSLAVVLAVLVDHARDIYGEYIESVVLYGSYARGTQSPESDVDIALIMKQKGSDRMHDALIDVIVNLELDYNVVLSVVPIDYTDYNSRNNIQPFYRNIKKEGIVLWKAA